MGKFDEDYYERGIETGVSCFENYRWLPELTLPAAVAIADYLGIERGASVLDYGCAKGFYVKAFRMLGRNAWGCDISEYAYSKRDLSVESFVKLHVDRRPWPFSESFDFVLAKDVLEHMTENLVSDFLFNAQRNQASVIFAIIPLAIDGKYVIPDDEKDATHIIRRDVDGWKDLLTNHGWIVGDFSHKVPGLKEHQTSKYESGVGFFTLRRG